MQLAGLQNEMAKLRAENAMLREALVAQDDGEEETEKLEAEDFTGAPVVPEPFLMTPPEPPAPGPEADYWAEAPGYSTEAGWTHTQPPDPPGFAQIPAAPRQDPWSKSAWGREPWCTPAPDAAQ